jgi:hypothetical protein
VEAVLGIAGVMVVAEALPEFFKMIALLKQTLF